MKKILLIFLILSLSACKTNERKRIDYAGFIEAQELEAKNRVTQFRFQGWQPLDERYLILRSNQNKSYLIKLNTYCNELPYAQSILLDQSSRTTLVAKFDAIKVPGQLPQKCTIDSIYEMDKVQKQALLSLKNPTEKMIE